MAKPSAKRLEDRLVNEIRYGIARAFHDQGKPIGWIANVMGMKRNSVGGTINSIADLSQLPPLIREQIIRVAKEVKDNNEYECELKMIVEMAKAQQSDDESKFDEQKVLSSFKRMYAQEMADLWYRLKTNQPAEIFIYQKKVVSPRETLEGKFWIVPKDVLPRDVKKINANRPYLGIHFDDDTLQMCDEDSGSLVINIIGVQKTYSKKEVIPKPLTIDAKAVRNFCYEFLQRNNYDLHRDLGQQIQERHKNELTPATMHEHVQLLKPAYLNRDTHYEIG